MDSNQELSSELGRALDPHWEEGESDLIRVTRLNAEVNDGLRPFWKVIEGGNPNVPTPSSEKTDIIILPSLGFYSSLESATIEDTQWVVFWEDPMQMAFRICRKIEGVTATDFLELWVNSTRRLLQAVRKNRHHIHLVNLSEVLAFPMKCTEFFQQQFDISLQVTDARPAPEEELEALRLCFFFREAARNILPETHYLLGELEASSISFHTEEKLKEKDTSFMRDSLYQGMNSLIDYHRYLKKYEEPIQKLERIEGVFRQLEAQSQRNYEMLINELQDAFHESEHHFEQWKKSEASGRELFLKVDSVNCDGVKNESEHRHIDYTFRGVKLFDLFWPTLKVRLVCHRGKSGFLIFACNHPDNQPLYNWVQNGCENDRPFMLFVLEDATARDLMIRATTSDLLMIRDAVVHIQSDLRVNGLLEESTIDWIQVAERLLEEIDDLPERLHYDHVKTEIKPEEEIRFEVINASFRWKHFGILKFSWNPNGEERAFVMHHAAGSNPELSSWPSKADGSFFEEFNLLLGNKTSDKVKLLWENFTRKEKDFLLMIISEIPNFLFHAASQHPHEELDLKKLNKKAKLLLKKALQFASLHGHSSLIFPTFFLM